MSGIPTIVFDGGPCGGKTTILTYVQDWLLNHGFHTVVVVPEAATLLKANGINIGEQAGQLSRLGFQRRLLQLWLDLEKNFQSSLKEVKGDKKVLLFDRGPMSCLAYLSEQEFSLILPSYELKLCQLRDRFTAIIHLVTAAEGAEEFYTLANNPARTETPEEARILDKRTREAWHGAPHMRVINNRADGLEGKKRRALRAVCRALDIPAPLEIERKWLVKKVDYDSLAVLKPAVVEIEQVYLQREPETKDVERIRQRGPKDSCLYTHTIKQEIRPGVRQEIERPITAREYSRLLRRADPERQVIKKRRFCFTWDGLYLELDVFSQPANLTLLEIELTEGNEAVSWPPCLDVERQVTEEAVFTNYQLARKC